MADSLVSFGLPMVVVLPLTQSIVPPVARAVDLMGFDFPPVLPPVQPLIVTVVDAFPLMFVQEIVTAAAPAAPPLTARQKFRKSE